VEDKPAPRWRRNVKAVRSSAASFGSDVAQGFFEISHNSFALVGLAVVFGVVTLTARPDLRQAGEVQLMAWLQQRQEPATEMEEAEPEFVELTAVERATAANPKELPKQQAAVAFWLSRKYKVAPEPLSALVAHAYEIGSKVKLDPTLILAVMAIESGFNPFAQSTVGAQGLMQVMTQVHTEKYEDFGGQFAAFDPVTNLRVGVKVLQECITRAGSVEAGLKHYVGAANLPTDGGYAGKVMAEYGRLSAVAGGKRPAPLTTADTATTPTPRLVTAPARTAPAAVPVKAVEPADTTPKSPQSLPSPQSPDNLAALGPL
jgi:Transglycosylase SLT domain